jgi:hypothetical protein
LGESKRFPGDSVLPLREEVVEVENRWRLAAGDEPGPGKAAALDRRVDFTGLVDSTCLTMGDCSGSNLPWFEFKIPLLLDKPEAIGVSESDEMSITSLLEGAWKFPCVASAAASVKSEAGDKYAVGCPGTYLSSRP